MGWRPAFVLLWLVFAAAIRHVAEGSAPVLRDSRLEALPTVLAGGKWRSRPSARRSEARWPAMASRPEDSCLRIYTNQEEIAIEAQIFYVRTRRPGNRLNKEAVNCLHGHYHSVERQIVAFQPGAEAGFLRLERAESRSSVLYWFQTPGLTTADNFRLLLHLYGQDLQRQRSDGCLVKLAYFGSPDPRKDAALADLAPFVHRALGEWLAR